MSPNPIRHLVLILGDQLDLDASGLDGFDAKKDRILMVEAMAESTEVPSSKQRTAVFLSAMRHFGEELKAQKMPLHYLKLDDPENVGTIEGELSKAITSLKPQMIVMTAPGDWRVLSAIKKTAQDHAVRLDIREDRHFFSSVKDFAEHAKGRKQLRLEYWYRELRAKHGILMDGQKPIGGAWNFDEQNRSAFGSEGPKNLPKPTRFAPDRITKEVIDSVNQKLASNPGVVSATRDGFGWPVTRSQALEVLDAFIKERLPHFGTYQDAMWTGEPWLYHSHLSSALNLKLLNAKEVVARAQDAYEKGRVPLNAAEGFIRQILGWREYVRGIYWMQMPKYAQLNSLSANESLPNFFWTGDTEMACLKDAISQTLSTGYAHHIQRLMVTGLYSLLLGVKPQEIHQWYLAVYVDAVEWVELPNTLGMSQFADGGVMASKPYAASGKYISRMSNYCKNCAFDPAESIGPRACPFTTLYWDFLARHRERLAANPRMVMQIKNLNRLDDETLKKIKLKASELRKH